MATKRKAGLIMSESQLKQRYGSSSGLASNIILPPENQLWLPSSVLGLNWQYSGGIPYGTILEEFGEEGTGKSTLAIDFGKSAQALGGTVLWVDAEAVFRVQANFYSKMGLDLSNVHLLESENILERVSDWQADMLVTMRSKLKNNEPILIVIDSTAALETEDNMETADSDSGEDMGRRSKKIYQMVRKRNPLYAKYGACVIYINQLRKKPVKTKFEDPDTTPGGNAMKFFASIRSGITRGKRIVDSNDEQIGQNVYFRMKKSKVGPPRHSIPGQVYFKETNGILGYSKYHGFHELLTEIEVPGTTNLVIKRNRGKWMLKGKLIANGDAKFYKLFEEDEDLRKKLIKRSGVNTISQARQRIESTTKNLYPVNAKKAKKDESSASGEEA